MGNRYNPKPVAPQPSQRLPGVTRPQPSNAQPSQKLPNNQPSVPEFQGSLPPGAPALPPPVAPQVGPQVGTGNGPVFPEDPAQAIAFNGGSYNPTTAPYGFDMSTPGYQQQMWDNNQAMWFQDPSLDWADTQLGEFQDPWAGEQQVAGMVGSMGDPGAGQQHWAGVQGAFNTMGNNVMGGYKGPNNAQTAFDMTKGMLPGSMQPQFDQYYDRMKDKVMSDVNSQSAARGAYGSNTALNNTIGAGLDVEAQRAKANTDFMLADSANQMGWQGLLGNQGRAADLTGLNTYDTQLKGAQFGLDRTKLGSDIAFRSEEMDLDKKKTQADLAFGLDDHKATRLGAGISTAMGLSDRRRTQRNDAFDAAGQANDERSGRINTLYDQTTSFTNDVQDFVSENLENIIGGDQAAFEQQIQAMLGQTADQRGWDQQTTERVWRDVKGIIDAAANGKEAGLI